MRGWWDSLFPAAHLHAAAGEEVGVAALDVLHLLHVMGVTCVASMSAKQTTTFSKVSCSPVSSSTVFSVAFLEELYICIA